MERIEYWRQKIDEAEQGLYEAMVAELPVGCRVIYEARVGEEEEAEVIEHGRYGLLLGIRDPKGNEFWIDLGSVTRKIEQQGQPIPGTREEPGDREE